MNTKQNISSKKGVTLIELMIYMVLSVIIMTMVIEFSKNSTIMSVKNLKRMAAIKSISSITSYVSEDLRRMGYKSATTDIDGVVDAVYYDLTDTDPAEHDSSSFDFTNNGDVDELEFRFYNEVTNQINFVKYSVNDNQELMRQLQTSELTAPTTLSDSVSVLMAEGITKFDLQFGSSMDEGTSGEVISIDNPDFTNVGGLTKTVGGIPGAWTTLFGFADPTTVYELPLIGTFEILKGESYQLSFDVKPSSDMSSSFDKDVHYMAFQFLDGSGSVIENLNEYTFYAGPSDESHPRDIIFSYNKKVTVSLVLRLMLPTIGTISFRNLVVTRLDEGVFDYRPDIPGVKTNVFKNRVNSLKVLINVEKLTIGGNNLPIQEEIEKIIPLKNNGS